MTADRILVVDDDQVIQQLLKVNLELEGYAVEVASDGEEALVLFDRFHPDLVLLDIMMPKLDGWEVARRLAKTTGGSVPIVLLSARVQESDVQKGNDLGVAAYMTKPFDPIQLLHLVSGIFAMPVRSKEEPLLEVSHEDPGGTGAVTIRKRLKHQGPVRRVSWSTNGDRLLVLGNKGLITIWLTANWVAHHYDINFQTISPGDPPAIHEITAGGFSPNGQHIAVYRSDGLIQVWSLPSSEVASLPGHQPVGDVVWLRKGTLLASTAADHAIRIWNPFTKGRPTIRHEDLEGHSAGIIALAVSPDGRWLASGSDSPDPEIIIWDLKTRQMHRRLQGHDSYVADLAWSQDGRTLVSASGDHNACVWDAQRGRLLHVLEGHTADVRGVDFSPNGRILVTKSIDGTIRLWSSDTWENLEIVNEKQTGGHWQPISFHPEQPILAVSSDRDRAVYLYKISPDLKPQRISRSVNHVTGKVVLVGDSGVGKTGLGWRLCHGSFRQHSSTHGQQFWALKSASSRRRDGAECEVVLWDLAGQPDYRLVHALFLDDADLALVLFNPTSHESPLQGVDFWLKALSRHGERQCSIILVGARLDRGSSTLTDSEIEAFCQARGIDGGYVGTSALDGTGVDELLDRIKSKIPWEDMPTIVTSSTFKRIRTYILSLKQRPDDDPVVTTISEMRRRLRRIYGWRVTPKQLSGAIGHLAKYGYVQPLPHPSGENVVLLKPDLLNNLASSFVVEARRNPRGLGALDETGVLRGVYEFPELQTISENEARILLDAATALFMRHNLCFRETHGGMTYLIFPALINQKRPVDDTLETTDYVSYVISGAVENVYPALAVLLGYTNVFARTSQWQNQARYEMDGGEICGFRQIVDAEGVISLVLYHAIGVGPQTSQLFQALVEQFLAGREVTVKRYPNLYCSKCQYAQERVEVVRRIDAGQSAMFCSNCGKKNQLASPFDVLIHTPADTFSSVRVQTEIASLRTRFETGLVQVKALGLQKWPEGPSCFISYAWGEPKHERWVQQRLAKDLRNAGISIILDQWRSAAIGTNLARFISEISRCDAIIIVGTPLYLRKYENAVSSLGSVVASEMDLINQRLTGTQSQKESVKPILRDGTSRSSLPPLVRGITYADFRADDSYLPTLFDLILALYAIPFDTPSIVELRDFLRNHG